MLIFEEALREIGLSYGQIMAYSWEEYCDSIKEIKNGAVIMRPHFFGWNIKTIDESEERKEEICT